MYGHSERLKLDHRPNGVLVITLDSPPTNPFEGDMHEGLIRTLEDVNYDRNTKVVVITGAGEKAFSAGGDISEMQRQIDSPADHVAALADARRILYAILRLEKPLIARLNGHAIGLGATVAMFCDLCYAVENIKIGDPHVAVGYAAGDGGALIWPQLIGYMRAREYLFTGDPIRSQDAAAMGMINRAVPRDQLDDVAFGMADRLAAGATVAINLTKQAVNLPLRRNFEGMIDASILLETISAFSEDHREAVDAFLNKRSPQFTGR